MYMYLPRVKEQKSIWIKAKAAHSKFMRKGEDWGKNAFDRPSPQVRKKKMV